MLQETLQDLIKSLEKTLEILNGSEKADLRSALHDYNRLPDKELTGLAAKSVDLLHETQLLLEPGTLTLADYFFGHVNCKCLNAAVELNVPDALREGSRTIEQLALVCNAREDRLNQVLRILYNNGIFAYDKQTKAYSNNHTSQLLLSDHWTQWRNWVDLYGNEFYDIGRGIPGSCRSGERRMAAQINFDTDLDMFTYFAQQGWIPRLHKTLSGGAIAQAPGILADYPWEEISGHKFIDVGGGGGGLVALVLRKHKTINAGVFDLQKAIDQARNNFKHPEGEYIDVGDRVAEGDLIVGNFLEQVPSCQVYTMKWCLHDWDSDHATTIMTNIRRSIIRSPVNRLVIFESLLSDGRSGRLSRYGDIVMAISANGEERTEEQWRDLAHRSGWNAPKIYHLRNAWVCAIELTPDWEFVGDAESLDRCCTAPSQSVRKDSSSPRQRPIHAIKAKMSFLEPWVSSRGNPFVRSNPADGFESTNMKFVSHDVQIYDSRPAKNSFRLDKHGFAYFLDAQSFTSEIKEALCAANNDIIRTLYYDRIQRLVLSELNASRVIIFDHTLRKGGSKSPYEFDNGRERELPAKIVHCDQSAGGAVTRLKQNIGPDENVDSIIAKGFQIVNIWRPVNGPVQDWPLATMDYQTAGPEDAWDTDLLHSKHEKRGQTVSICYSDRQKWYYLSQHGPDEVVMIKIWDSREGVSKYCAHAAFDHPHTSVNACPRESIEVRCLVLY